MSGWGFVYILGSQAMSGVYKIGFTARSPSARAEELSKATGVPYPYQVLYYAEFDDAARQERLIHQRLSERRINADREFFRGPLVDLVKAVQENGELTSEWRDSEEVIEAFNPGCMNRKNPLWFEQSLHSPGYLERLRRATA